MRLLVRAAVLLCVAIMLGGCGAATNPADRLLSRADRLYAQGKKAEAAKAIEAAIASDPRRNATYARAIRILNARSEWRELARVGDKLLARAMTSSLDIKVSKPEIATFCAAVSQSHWLAGEKLRGEEIARKGLALEPDNPHLLNNLGYYYADRGVNLTEAVKLTSRAADLAPDNPSVLDSLGWAQYKSGDYKSATKTLKKATSLEPTSAEIRYHLGAVYAKRGMAAEAKVELRKSLALDPSVTKASDILKTIHK